MLETERLLLRPWRVSEAAVQRELWAERDPRVPPHRRIDAEGRPTLEDIENWIRSAAQPSTSGLLAVVRKTSGDVIGYCGLVDGGRGAEEEPELAFELLRRFWGQGYATEASLAVLDWARSSGHQRVWATVWDWNTGLSSRPGKARFHRDGPAGGGRRTRDHPVHDEAALTATSVATTDQVRHVAVQQHKSWRWITST